MATSTSSRIKVLKNGGKLELRVPSYKPWFAYIIFLIVLPFFIRIFSGFPLFSLLNGDLFSMIFTTIAVFILATILIHTLWNLFGSERIIIRNGLLVLHQGIFGLGIHEKYFLPDIKNLKYFQARKDWLEILTGKKAWLWDYSIYRTLSFDYQGDKIDFGLFLTKQEAEQVIRELQQNAIFVSAQKTGSHKP